MRGRPAARDRKAADLHRGQRRELRRQQVVREHDRARGDAERGRFGAEDRVDDAQRDVADVVGTLGDAGVARGAQLRLLRLGGGHDRRGSAHAVGDRRIGAGAQVGIIEDRAMRVEHAGKLPRPRRCGRQRLRHRREAARQPRRLDRDALAARRQVRYCDMQPIGRADREPGRGGDTADRPRFERGGCASHRCGRGRSRRGVHFRGQQRDDRVDHPLRPVAACLDRHRRAGRQPEREQSDRTRRRGRAILAADRHFGPACAHGGDDPRGGPGMQAMRQAHDRVAADHGAGDIVRHRGACRTDDAQQRIADRDQPLGGAIGERDALALDDDHRGDGGRRSLHHAVEIEADQRIARPHPVAGRDEHRKPLSVQRDRIDADVHQQRHAAARIQRHRMAGGMDRQHNGVARRVQRIAGWIDRDPRPHHPLGKDRVGHGGKRQDPSCEWRHQLHVGHSHSHPRHPARSLSHRRGLTIPIAYHFVSNV